MAVDNPRPWGKRSFDSVPNAESRTDREGDSVKTRQGGGTRHVYVTAESRDALRDAHGDSYSTALAYLLGRWTRGVKTHEGVDVNTGECETTTIRVSPAVHDALCDVRDEIGVDSLAAAVATLLAACKDA